MNDKKRAACLAGAFFIIHSAASFSSFIAFLMLSRYGSRFFLALLLLGGVFLLANTFVMAWLTGGTALLPPQYRTWGFGLVLTLILGVPVLLLITGWSRRSYRQLEAVARQSQRLTGEAQQPEAADFVLATFRAAVDQLQAQRSELQQLHSQVSARAASAERLSAHIVASVPSGLIAFDQRGRATLLNGAAQKLLETPEDALGLEARILLRRAPHLIDLVTDCLQNGTLHQREEIWLRHADGRQRRLGASVSPLESGAQGGALCLFTDLTEVAQLREQLTLKKNLENLGEMSAGLAHEFKNALAALQSYGQLLQDNDLPRPARLAADGLLDEVGQLTEMVTAFLNFARPHPLQLSEVSLRELLAECAVDVLPLCDEKGVRLAFAGEFPTVRADELMLRQACVNLLRNAVEAFTDEQDSPCVTIHGTRRTNPSRIALTFTDNGPGLAPENLERVFIPFFTTKTNGHGIGLALAHRVITQHGGTLTAANAPGGGAVFRIELLLA